MATFAKTTFSASSYATFRPTYSQPFYTSLLAYHRGPRSVVLELGTGHGTVARNLSPFFTKIIATDPSATMLKTARASPSPPNIEFQTASAEDLSFVSDESVDLVIAGQAAHWFDFSKTWSEIGRVLRKDGTVAFWGYKDNVFPDYPKANRVLDHYCYSAEPGMMGPYWEQPGRSILRDLYRAIEPPGELFRDVERREYEQAIESRGSGKGERVMFRQLSLGEVEGYVRTFSAFANWKEDHRDRKPKAEGEAGDVVDELFEKMLEAEDEWRQEGEAWREKVVETEWGSVMLYARKK